VIFTDVQEKEGTCPEADRSSECPPDDTLNNICLMDNQCAGSQKCCSDGCEFKCVDPIKSETETEGFYFAYFTVQLITLNCLGF